MQPRRCGFLALAVSLAWAMPAVAQQPTYPAAQPQYRVATSAPPQSQPSADAQFQLTPQQQAFVDQILELWEQESGKIKSFKCSFERWEYDPVFGPKDPATPKTKSLGQLKYAKPDKGMFRIDEILHYTASQTAGGQPTWQANEGEPGEHWVCDGEAVYEFNAVKKQLIVAPLPPEMRGNAIAEGPLPFLFGAEKDKLKARYFIRVTQSNEKEIWLEAYPRRREDAANFRKVELILNRERFLPTAMAVYLPNGKSHTTYIFGEAKVNDPLERFIGVFQQPRTPLGWTKIVEQIPTGGTAQQEPLRR